MEVFHSERKLFRKNDKYLIISFLTELGDVWGPIGKPHLLFLLKQIYNSKKRSKFFGHHFLAQLKSATCLMKEQPYFLLITLFSVYYSG